MKYLTKYYESIEWDDWDIQEESVPEEFEGHEDFYNFLVENDALDKFIYNYKKNIGIKDYLDERKKKGLYRQNVNAAFLWTPTKDGYYFWHQMHNKWIEYLRNKTYNESIDWDDWDIQEESVPEEFEGHEDFYNFLVDNGALDKYMKNFNFSIYRIHHRLHQHKGIKHFLDRKKKNGTYELNVSAFLWSHTKEGHDFWNKLDTKWAKYLKANESIDWDDWDTQEEPSVPEEFEGHEDFYNFLVENDILDKFIYNYNNYKKNIGIKGIKDYLDERKKNGTYELNVSAFLWTPTKEGADFWYQMHNKWVKYLRNKTYNESIDWDDWDTQEEPIIPEEFEGHEDFYNFLVENEALDKYMKNFNFFEYKRIKRFLNTKNKYDYIISAFTWIDAGFWVDIHNKWKAYLYYKKKLDNRKPKHKN